MQPTTRTVFCAWVVFCLRYSITEAHRCEGRQHGTCPQNSICQSVPFIGIHRCVTLVETTTTNTPASGEVLPATSPLEDEMGQPVVEARSDDVCPRQQGDHRRCVTTCSYDQDCREEEACCSTGCGHMCMPRRQSNVQKHGYCRAVSDAYPEPCGYDCGTDSDCPGITKCCPSTCGRTCQAPCYHWLTSNPRLNDMWEPSARCSQSQAADRTPSAIHLPYGHDHFHGN